jgi:hypothetical protein
MERRHVGPNAVILYYKTYCDAEDPRTISDFDSLKKDLLENMKKNPYTEFRLAICDPEKN